MKRGSSNFEELGVCVYTMMHFVVMQWSNLRIGPKLMSHLLRTNPQIKFPLFILKLNNMILLHLALLTIVTIRKKKSLAKWQELQHYNSIIFPTSYKNDKWCWVCIQCWWHYTVVYKQYWVWQLEPVTLNIIFSLVKACKALLCSFELGQVILFLNTQSWHCWWSMCY